MSDYQYELPERLIAQEPLTDRAGSRMLHVERSTGLLHHRKFRDIVELLEPGDLLVLNDTRVTALRLLGVRPTGGKVEALLLRSLGGGRFQALLKPGKRLKPGAEILFEGGLCAQVQDDLGEGIKVLQFRETSELDRRLATAGATPLPPYIHKQLADPERYQTVFARAPGSSAAPTAGLHFDQETLSKLAASGIESTTITLDVGLDTFRPIQSESIDAHAMHGERCEVSQQAADAVSACRGRIVPVGTTAMRTLESMAAGKRRLRTGSMETRLFIRPGYEFQIADGLLTNFHLPGTTMLLMVAALIGRHTLMRAYSGAVEQQYRFLSFGDAMLVL